MARFRRRVRYLRRPVRRYRRRKYFRQRRRVAKGSMYVKITKCSTVQVPNNTTSTWGTQFKPADLPEYEHLAPNFERVKFLRIKVRVIPMQNVSNSSTSLVPGYCMLPWHNPGGVQKDFNTFLSCDRAKIYRQTERGHQSYVPNTLIHAASEGSGAAYQQMVWKPEIRRTTNVVDQPTIYAGLIAFQGDTTLEGRTSTFNVIQDIYCIFRNQTTFTV